jgi:hypothetical protein
MKPSNLRVDIALAKLTPASIDFIEGALDAWAKQHALETGMSFAKAYDDLLLNDETARELYAKFRSARDDPSVLAKRREELCKSSADSVKPYISDAERALNDLADEVARKKSITKAAAYDEVLQTDEGRALYAKYRDKRRSMA